jgi:phage terminase large subunit-like protein
MEEQKKLWKKSPKQRDFADEIARNKYTLLIGAGRSGKSLLIVLEMFRFAIKYENTNQIIFRNTLSSAIVGIWNITIPEVIKNFFPALPLMDGFVINKSRHEIRFPNGSMISIKGLDNKDKVQKLLSIELQCVFFDESHLTEFEHFGLVMSRMPSKLNVPYENKVICAANWCPRTHWLKKFFLDKVNPETNAPHNLSVGMMTSVTADNLTIDAAEYTQSLLSGADRRTRLACAGTGFYDEAEGALWLQDDIKRKKALEIEKYDDIVVGYDPAVSNTKSSDGHGICIAGKKDGEYHVLYSWEKIMDVNDCAAEICRLYKEFNCSKVVVEVNCGGDFIPSLFAKIDASVYCEVVRATKGKILRAEPIAALYKNEKVFHAQHFQDLEEQMVTFNGFGASPNSLDALVWALTYLSSYTSFVDPDAI